MAVEPSGEKIFDPFLGEERDAFPGEIVPEDQETSFQRALREVGQPYLALYNDVADELSPEELRAILKAREIAINKKATELEQAFLTNPATIIQQALRDSSEGINRLILFEKFNRSIARILDGVATDQTRDQSQGYPIKPTEEYVSKFVSVFKNSPSDLLTEIYTGRNTSDKVSQFVFNTLMNLGGIPLPQISNFKQLVSSLPFSPGDETKDKPYLVTNSDSIKVNNLKSKRPGLEGVYFELDLDKIFKNPILLKIYLTRDVATRIVDKKAGFTPFTPE